MGSALIDRRTARMAVVLAVAGSLMLMAGLGVWAVSALGHAIPHSAHTTAWLAAVALITAGVCCGVLMIVVLLGSDGRTVGAAEPSWSDPHSCGPLPPGTVPPGAQVPGPSRGGPLLPEGHPSGPRPANPCPPAGPSPHPGPPPGSGAPPAAEPGRPAAGEPALNLWPTPDPAPVAAGSPASPVAEQLVQDEEPDDGPVHRVESAFNVWQRPNQDAGPAAAPADAAASGAVLPEPVLPEPVLPEPVTAEPAAPALTDQDQSAATAPSTQDWVQHAAPRLRDADLLPDAGSLPARGLRPPAHERPAELADDEAELDPVTRPPAPRRSGPDPGWNPDSEEDWLRVLRGLRASEDG